MSTPYMGEIRLFGFSRIPTGWHACDGALLQIAEWDALYALIGAVYGGDGQTTFGLPDLRGQAPLHQGQGPGLTSRPIGQGGGSESVTLTTQQMPAHTHSWIATTGAATTAKPDQTVTLGAPATDAMYATSLTNYQAYPLNAASVQPVGGGLPHDNMMPTLTANFCIALYGVFPSQT